MNNLEPKFGLNSEGGGPGGEGGLEFAADDGGKVSWGWGRGGGWGEMKGERAGKKEGGGGEGRNRWDRRRQQLCGMLQKYSGGTRPQCQKHTALEQKSEKTLTHAHALGTLHFCNITQAERVHWLGAVT